MTEENAMTEEASAESPSGSSPDSTASEQHATAEKPVNQEAVNKRINDITAQRYEEKARADAAEARLAELEAKQPIAPAGTQETVIPQADIEPPSPDLHYDDPAEYARQMNLYQESIATKSFAKQQESAQAAEEQRLENERNQQQDTQRQMSVEKSAETHGIDINEVHKSAVLLNQRGTNSALGQLLLEHENSAPLIDYLAKNPGDFDQLNQLTNPISIIRSLDNIQPKAIQRNISSAPDPVTGLKGSPAREGDDFDKRFPSAAFK